MRKLRLNFSHNFDHKLWNIANDEHYRYLLLELRDDTKLNTCFYLLDLSNNQFLFRDITFNESWWIGVSHIGETVIVFHTYEHGENPERKEYFAIDFKGNIIWQRQGGKWLNWTGDSAMFIDNDLLTSAIDLKSGKPLNEVNRDEVKKAGKGLILHPLQYVQDQAYFDLVQQFVKQRFDHDIIQSVDYLEKDELIIMSYFFKEKDKMMNDLTVINPNNDLLLKERLGEQLEGISEDTFFICNDSLIFVKDKSILNIYEFV